MNNEAHIFHFQNQDKNGKLACVVCFTLKWISIPSPSSWLGLTTLRVRYPPSSPSPSLVLREGPPPALVPGRALSEGRTILLPPGQPRKPSPDSPPLPSGDGTLWLTDALSPPAILPEDEPQRVSAANAKSPPTYKEYKNMFLQEQNRNISLFWWQQMGDFNWVSSWNFQPTGRYSEKPGEVREDPQRTSTANPRSPPTWQFFNLSFARFIAWQERIIYTLLNLIEGSNDRFSVLFGYWDQSRYVFVCNLGHWAEAHRPHSETFILNGQIVSHHWHGMEKWQMFVCRY